MQHTSNDFYARLGMFLAVLEREQEARLRQEIPGLHEAALEDGRRAYYEFGYDEGTRFVKVWDATPGRSVRYFVEKSTGIIFGAATWSRYNPRRVYGDLTTIGDWEWGGYEGRSKHGVSTLVPKSARR